MSTYVTIGRKTGSANMSPEAWADFRRQLDHVVMLWAGPIVTRALGSGEYEGQREDSYIVVGAKTLQGPDASVFKARIAVLAEVFEQESIAVTIAPVEFVERPNDNSEGGGTFDHEYKPSTDGVTTGPFLRKDVRHR